MNRRTFNRLAGFAAVGAVTDRTDAFRNPLVGSKTGSSAKDGEVILQDDLLLVAFDTRSGALTRMLRKSTGWMIQPGRDLGVSFRLHAPLPDRRANFVLGKNQHAASVERLPDEKVQFEWKDLISEHGGVLPMTFAATVGLKNGTLTFESTLQNDSAFTVETIDYPYFGDLRSPSRDTSMQAEHMWYGNLAGTEIYPDFFNEKGYWGVQCPTKTIGTNASLFCLIQTPREGLYTGVHDPTLQYYVEFTFEQHPGVIQSLTADVPRQDDISGIPVHLDFRACHFVFASPHSNVELAPVVMRAYDGDWHAGIDAYKEWRATWFVAPKTPAWIRDVHSWLQLQVDGAEQDYTIPYSKIEQYGKECANNGVSAIQLVGWNRGGQDGGDPSLDTDPGLGSWQELHDAIARVQSIGVKMILFGKPIFADMSTDYYRKELHQYEATDPYGNPYESSGYSYTTPTQLAGINNRRRAIMDVLSRDYRDIATREFEKIPALGASGWLFDEVLQHNGILYSFSKEHGYRGPGYLFRGDMPLARQFRASADKVNPDFLFAGEGQQDWLMQYYPLSYFRIHADTRHVCRYLDPTAPLMVAVTGFDDREMLNLILAYRYIISYEPYNFKGHVTDFPLTLAYGKKIDALRRRYREYLWDGEFRDTLGVKLSSEGSSRHTLFVTRQGKRAVVVVNLDMTRVLTAQVELPNMGKLKMATPEHPEAVSISDTIEVPARSAAVVLEQ